jgi:hypothetical protein
MPSRPSNRTCLAVRTGIACGLLAALGSACGSDSSAPKTSRSSGAEAPRAAKPLAPKRRVPAKGEEPDRRAHMEATFWMAIIARDALIDGDLEATRSVAHELAEHDYGNAFPPSWKHWVGDMQKQARALAIAADEAEAGQAVGALAVACGNCHRDQKGGFRLPDAEAMPWQDPPETITARMDRHAVGIEQMWFGLIAPSDDVWRAGTVTLTRAPLEAPEDGDEPVDGRLHAKFEHLRDLAKQARLAPTDEERAHIYGEAITTCAHCHYTTSYIDP